MAEVEQRDHQVVRFYDEAVLDMAKSEAAQRPIFTDMVLAEVKWAGEPGSSWVGPAEVPFRLVKGKVNRQQFGFERRGGWESPAEAFPQEWGVFKGRADARKAGTTLDRLPFLSKAKIAELTYMEIHTAEQLASIGEGAIKHLGMGGRGLVEQAKAWLSDTADKSAAAAAIAEKTAMEDRIAKLEAALAAKPAAPSADRFEGMDDDELKAFIVSMGGNPRANAARDKLLAACRELAEMAA